MKTLIVEDDFISRIVLQKILAPFGVCDIAVNGKEAVQAFTFSLQEGEPYDLICMDIMMPEMDGIEAVRLIHEKEKEMNVAPSDEVKVIMITALDTPKEVVDAYYRGGCTSYLTKPINKGKIVKLIKEMELV